MQNVLDSLYRALYRSFNRSLYRPLYVIKTIDAHGYRAKWETRMSHSLSYIYQLFRTYTEQY